MGLLCRIVTRRVAYVTEQAFDDLPLGARQLEIVFAASRCYLCDKVPI
jgi:hypothetical protein